jgi:hypothetical protein
MGITAQHCSHGTSINTFALENSPNAPKGSVPDGCHVLAPRQPPTLGPAIGLSSGLGQQIDDAVGARGGDRTEIQDDVFLFAVFQTSLPPPPRGFSDRISIMRGAPLFSRVGCAHRRAVKLCSTTLSFAALRKRNGSCEHPST